MSLQATSRDAFFVAGVVGPLLLVWAATWFVVPRFADLYADFGAELPWATRWLLASYRHGFAMNALVIAVWAWRPRPSNRGLAALVAAVTSAAVSALSALIALYLPINRLGASAG
jgi:hypothetical protein